MVIIVPTLSHRQKRHPGNIDAIIGGGIRLVAQFGQMTDHIQQERYLLNSQSRGKIGDREWPTENETHDDSAAETYNRGDRMSSMPVASLLEETIDRIADQVFGLNCRVDM